MIAASEAISAWVATLSYGDIPEDVIASTRFRVLDVLGLSIAGGETAFGASVRASAILYPGDEARLWGTNRRASAAGAAFVNGALSQALEYDDTHNESIVHMSSPSVAAALALGERIGSSGRDLIRAVAIGNEISARVGSVTPQQFHKRGFHPSGLFAPFGVCWLASSLLGLEPKQMVNAAGITGSFAAGLIQCWVDGTQSKFLHPGWAAQSGIAAAVLGQSGVTGPTEVFEGRFGLFASHLQAADPAPNFGRLTDGLGDTWDSRNSSFKPFPVAHVSHPYITAALRLRERHGLTPDTIARVILPVAPYIVGIVCEPLHEKRRPLTDSHGRVSLQYTIAEAFALGRIGKDAYAPQSLRDPTILALTDRVDFVVDPSMPGSEQFKGVVIVETTDGQRFEEIEEHNRGSAKNPMSREEIEGKFRENVAGVLDPSKADAVIAAVMRLETIDDVSAISALTVASHD
jgi:2-methylcitrate dehydratase PrpD